MTQEIARESSPRKINFPVSRLPFSQIPHQSRLFTQYQSDPLSLRRFYPNAVTSPSEIASYVPTVLANYHTDRTNLADVLTEINSKINAGPGTFANIEKLRDPKTVAVVTGQQAGLFTGPLYTLYKALSAVKLAETLDQSGTSAVPVFWAATEDHDFDEVSKTFFIGKNEKLIESKYSPLSYVQNVPVGKVEIDDGIDNVIRELFEDLPATEFSVEVRELVATSWVDGTRFGDAFETQLAAILSRFGIVFIDPLNPGIKRLSAPIFENTIANVGEIISGLVDRNCELEHEGYHSQVLIEDDYFPMFWEDDEGRRMALRRSGEGKYRTREGKREFTLDELSNIAAIEPQRFSPGVMLRPVVQDYLLPTICYFGGGAEIAYFAQNSEVYRVLERPVAPVFHRQSFTVVEARHRRVLEKFDLTLVRLFEGLERVVLQVAEEGISSDTARMFAEVEEKIGTEMDRLDHAVTQIDVTLAANVATRRRKIAYHIAVLRKKALLAQARKDETVTHQLDSLFATILPNGELQERSLNVVSFLNKFGPNFVDWIYEAIDLEDKDHRIIEL